MELSSNKSSVQFNAHDKFRASKELLQPLQYKVMSWSVILDMSSPVWTGINSQSAPI